MTPGSAVEVPVRAPRLDARAILMPILAGIGIGVWAWFCASSLQPLAYEDRALEYVFLGASAPVFASVALVVALVLLAGHVRLLQTETIDPAASREGYLEPLAMLGLTALGAVVLLPGVGPRLSPLAYVLVDLRLWWSLALMALSLWRFDSLRGHPWWTRVRRSARRPGPSGRRFALDALLVALLLLFSLVSARYLRFTSVLHGDEPKYLRYCENFYQGLGLDLERQQPLAELTLAFDPPVWRNLSLFGQAVRQDVRFLIDDARQFARDGAAMRFNRAQYIDGGFLRGRDGGVYQVHNPGLSFVLFPAYFIDRHFLTSSAGYQDVFPTLLPATNLMILLLWSVWGVTVFRMLRAGTGRDGLAWLLAATAMLTMPVSAFGFQIYPEAAGGMIVTLVFTWLVFCAADDSPRRLVIAAGAALGFLPWLDVRFILLSVVLALWAIAALRRRRRSFVIAYALVIAALCLYAYHLTGSFRPAAMYEAEGGPAPWRARDAIEAFAAYPLDRIWGFLPHAPVYLFAVPGWLLAVRRWPRAAVLAALLVLALVVPSAGHGFSRGGATPLRHLVVIVPLAMIPMAATLRTFGSRAWVRASFIVLLVISLDAALSYNLHHRKEVGRFVDFGVSGWAPNLVFPWTHAGPWQHWRGTFVLFLLWVAALAALFIVPYTLRRRAPAGAGATGIRHVLGVTTIFVLAAAGAAALGGEWVRADYFVPLEQARRATLDFATALDRCRICYSTARGEIGRGEVVADGEQTFTFEALNPEVRAGERVEFRASVIARHGAGWGPVALDFGDDAVRRMELRGETRLEYVYRTPGRYHVTARFTPHGAPPQPTHASIAVRAAAVDVATIAGLPDALRRAPVRGTTTRVWLGPEGVNAETSGSADSPVVWLLQWTDEGWIVVPSSSAGDVPPGSWVAVVTGAADGSSRTPPVEVRWPDPAVALAARVALYDAPVTEARAPR